MKAERWPEGGLSHTRIVYCGDGGLFVLVESALPAVEAAARINSGLLPLPFAAPGAGLRAECHGRVVVVARSEGIRRQQVRLSAREAQVLAAVSQGYSLPEVGKQLGLRVSTVRSYLASLKVKLSARNMPSLVSRAAEWGLLG
jgi:DNA-binding CsgD family transcriptional regulator